MGGAEVAVGAWGGAVGGAGVAVAQARHSLSQAFFDLRRITGDATASPPFLLATPQTIQLNPFSDHWLDVAALAELLASPTAQFLEDAVSLYRGPFLEGFSLPDSIAFEEWALLERERQHRLHEVVRQFAAALLQADSAAADDATTRYCIYFDAWLREQGARMTGPQQKMAFDAVAVDLENGRHAWLLSIERGHYGLANQALKGITCYLDVRGTLQSVPALMQEGLERLPASQLDGRRASICTGGWHRHD